MNIAKHSFSSIWPRKVNVKKLQMFKQNHGLTLLQKMQIFQVPNINLFVVQKTKIPNSWTNPFVKNTNFATNINVVFVEELIFYQEHCQRLFLMNLTEKSEGKETTNLLSKSWTTPSSKYQLICSLENFFLGTSLNSLFEQF